MVRSLCFSDTTFWFYFAALTLCSIYYWGSRSVIALALAGHSTGSRMDELESFIIDQQGVIRGSVCRPGDWTSVNSLQVLTRWINVMFKAADAHPSDHGARKG